LVICRIPDLENQEWYFEKLFDGHANSPYPSSNNSVLANLFSLSEEGYSIAGRNSAWGI